MSTHTQGPWQVDGTVIRTAGPANRSWRYIATVAKEGTREHPMDAGNARLIAAAPDMLEALVNAERLLRAVHGYSQNNTADSVYNSIRRTIAKATDA